VAQLQTFTFELFIFMELMDVMIIRERGLFWGSRPSLFLLLAITGDLVVVYGISVFGLPGIAPISPATALLVPGLLIFLVFIVNDSFKVFLVRRYYPASAV